MANKTSTKKCSTLLKEENKIANNLQLSLERDILRLFQDSLYCDIKLTVDSSSVLTHSCILKTRASRFYKFIYSEFEFLEQNGISVFTIYNASFAYLQTFVENIYTNIHSSHAEDCIIKHLQETQFLDKNKLGSADPRLGKSAITPESDLFFTPKCSPTELQKPFAPSKLRLKENNVASYYRIVSVDDIPVDEKLEGKNSDSDREEKAFEKELAEQDELFSSFKTIFSKKQIKGKPNSLSLGNSSQSAKKTKPKFNRKFESNTLLYDDQDKGRHRLPFWKPSSLKEKDCSRDKYSGLKTFKRNFRLEEKIDSEPRLEETANSDMDVSTTGVDSGLDNSSICQPEISPRENTVSETSGVDLTEAAINEEIPKDETISTKRSTGSSASSEVGTWDGGDDFRARSPSSTHPEESLAFGEVASDKSYLNEEEVIRLDEMEKNIRDCEIFLYMERQNSGWPEKSESKLNHSATKGETPPSNYETEYGQETYRYANEEQVSNPEESQGETGHRQNNDEDENYYNYSYCSERNSNDAIKEDNYEVGATECLKEGASGDIINSDFDYFAQPDILRDVQETKTPPCTPKKVKTEKAEEREEKEEEIKSKSWENHNSTSVSNYFIDASSLIDEDEIISPPISLINFKSLRGGEREVREEEVPETVSKTIVSNFFGPDSSEGTHQKDNERRQGEMIFKNSIPHFSKHEVNENQFLEAAERLRGGADHFSRETVEDESEQVVPSADIEVSPTSMERDNPVEDGYPIESNYFEAASSNFSMEYESESPEEDRRDGNGEPVRESHSNVSAGESLKDVSSSSVCSGSPNLRRNEFAPIVSGGLDFVEEERKKVQRKPSQSQGEAWIVTFEDDKKSRARLSSSGTGSEVESGRENGEEGRVRSVQRSRVNRHQPPVEFHVREKRNESNQEERSERRENPVEKSSSFGYFLDFGKGREEEEEVERKGERSEGTAEKKNNMFSMFIGMDDDSNSSHSRKSKPTLEREGTFNKSVEESPQEATQSSDEVKKSFYMFIESDSPSVKRKQMPKRFNRSEAEPAGGSTRKNYLRTQSYTVERNPEERSKTDVKTDVECSSSDNSLPYVENGFKATRSHRGRLPLPLNKSRGASREGKFTAWGEAKHPNEEPVSSESWLRTKDVQVNYKERGDGCKESVYLKKDSTFVMGNERKDKGRRSGEGKPPERDSGVILCEKGDDGFVKLSDLDGRRSHRTQESNDRMSQSVSEGSGRRSDGNRETSLSKSIGCEGGKQRASGVHDRQANRSLSRLFPNLSAQSLASFGRKDGENEVQPSEASEVSSSMQSSVEPTGLEISTSETDVSTHVGTTSRLGEDLLKMFLEEISPDVVVEVGGRRIKAHKCILSSRCQYFAAMLSGGWVESAGNVISLQGFSYNAVHFALRHIYSGESRIPESLNIVELATLADMLCLDGLQEIISYNLKVKYCHSFHVPCSICSVGVIDCLPVTAAYGLDDLYRKCLRWITKYFVKIWPTKSFGSLPKELLEKCYQHQVVHMTVDNVLDTIVNIDKVRGSLPNVRWAEAVSRLVNKLHDATVKYIAEHFSSILTSDNFLALGKEAGWNVSRLEDSLIETINYLPPEQACWSHARLHRILSVATGQNPPPEMSWNENFLKLLQVLDELVENSLIKQAPRAARSKAWKQMEPELRNRIQEAACLVLPDQEPSSGSRRSLHLKKDFSQPNIPQTMKSRNLEIRQIKLAMSQQATRNPNTSRPLSLQIDQRPKKDSRFIPLRPSVSTSSVRKSEPMEGIRKTQSRSQILGSTISEPKKTVNPKYSEVKSRYLEPRSPQKTASGDSNQRRTFRCVSSSDSSRNCSPALRSSNSRSSIPQARKSAAGTGRQEKNSVLRSGSTSTLDGKRDKSFVSARSDSASARTLSRLAGEENMSTDSLCTDSLASEKEATLKRRPGKENAEERRKSGNWVASSKSNSGSPVARRQNPEKWSSASSKTVAAKKLIISRTSNETKSNPPKRFSAGTATKSVSCKSNVSSPRTTTTTTTTTTTRNQRNLGRTEGNLVNGNWNRKRNSVDSENNKKNSKESPDTEPSAVSRSGTFLKDEPTILKKPQVGAVESEV